MNVNVSELYKTISICYDVEVLQVMLIVHQTTNSIGGKKKFASGLSL